MYIIIIQKTEHTWLWRWHGHCYALWMPNVEYFCRGSRAIPQANFLKSLLPVLIDSGKGNEPLPTSISQLGELASMWGYREVCLPLPLRPKLTPRSLVPPSTLPESKLWLGRVPCTHTLEFQGSSCMNTMKTVAYMHLVSLSYQQMLNLFPAMHKIFITSITILQPINIMFETTTPNEITSDISDNDSQTPQDIH